VKGLMFGSHNCDIVIYRLLCGHAQLSLLLSPWTGQRLDFSLDQVIYADKHRIDDDVFRSLSYPPRPKL
jgi:hypothetical protein